MEKSRLELKVGLFVFIGLLLMAALIIQFSKGATLFRQTYTVRLEAANVAGLKNYADVLLAGVPIGRVSHIQLAPDSKSVNIDLQIYQENVIFHDARFVIESSGLLGDQFVSITPTVNALPVLTNGAVVQCQAPFDLQGLLKRFDNMATNLEPAIGDLRQQVFNAGTLANLSAALTNFRTLSENAKTTMTNLNLLISTNQGQICQAVSNFVNFSSQLNDVVDNVQDILSTNGFNLNTVTRNFADTSAAVKELAAGVQRGQGLAGVILQDPQMAANLQNIVANLAITSSNLNRGGLWGILWAHKTPATNSPYSTTTGRHGYHP